VDGSKLDAFKLSHNKPYFYEPFELYGGNYWMREKDKQRLLAYDMYK